MLVVGYGEDEAQTTGVWPNALYLVPSDEGGEGSGGGFPPPRIRPNVKGTSPRYNSSFTVSLSTPHTADPRAHEASRCCIQI